MPTGSLDTLNNDDTALIGSRSYLNMSNAQDTVGDTLVDVDGPDVV